MICRVLFLSALFLSSQTLAEDSSDLCRLMPAHVAGAGVEHIGDADVPADLHSMDAALNTVHIPVTIDIIERFGLDVPNGIEMNPDVAVIAVQPDGHVLYNGRDLSAHVATVCGQNDGTDGQAGADALGSSPAEQQF